jgi:hypothetical protein
MAVIYRVLESSQTYLKFPLTPSLSPVGTVSQCHSEALAEACPEQSEGTSEILHFVQDDTLCQILHGVYPEPKNETLRFAQGDKWRRVQNDKHGISFEGIRFLSPNYNQKSERY